MIPMLAIGGGMLTLLVFVVLALFGIVAWFSLRKHIRGIEVPPASQGGIPLREDASSDSAQSPA